MLKGKLSTFSDSVEHETYRFIVYTQCTLMWQMPIMQRINVLPAYNIRYMTCLQNVLNCFQHGNIKSMMRTSGKTQ